MEKVKVQIDEENDRYFECPTCNYLNWLAPVETAGMKVDCELCGETIELED